MMELNRGRQIVLDTETTGLEPAEGHRVIEIGAVELVDRRVTGRTFHHYINPDREIDAEAIEVHGITNDYLRDKPRFHDLSDEFVEFIRDAELIAHNAPFDVGFLNHELALLDRCPGTVEDFARVVDSLELARDLHPGMKNSLDALCRRYEVDNSNRELHGALLDARLLAEVYLRMTGGQITLSLEVSHAADRQRPGGIAVDGPREIMVRRASEREREAHRARLTRIDEATDGGCVWLRAERSGH